MVLKEIKIKTIIDITVIHAEKSNRRRGLPKNKRNPEGALFFMQGSTLKWFRDELIAQ